MRPLWLRLLIAVVFFVVCVVIIVPAWLVIVIGISPEFGATLGGPGEAAHGATVEWFDPVANASLGVIIVLVLFMTWKVFDQPDRLLRRSTVSAELVTHAAHDDPLESPADVYLTPCRRARFDEPTSPGPLGGAIEADGPRFALDLILAAEGSGPVGAEEARHEGVIGYGPLEVTW
ncbi:MAG TPA: hypothetical protein VGR26_07510 [Acidimicrobiales bacterium]|nr:hypothetical protein [Acidimicrobiales bacterium]